MTHVSPLPKHYLSDKVEHFTESVIREMTRQAMLHNAHQLGTISGWTWFGSSPTPATFRLP